MLKQKFKATLIHFLLSVALVALIIGSILFLFFPELFIGVTDFKEVALIIVCVDLVLGPLLTFVVFNPNKTKKSLYLDFSVIAAIQLSAVLYGAFSLFQIHPVYVTFNIDRFTIVTAKDAEPEKAIVKEYKISKFDSGKLAFAKMPADLEKQNKLLFDTVSGGRDLDQRVEYYEPYNENINQIISKGLNPLLILSNAKSDKNISTFIDKHRDNIDEFIFLPINSANKDAIIVLDKKTAQPIATINSDPWELSQK